MPALSAGTVIEIDPSLATVYMAAVPSMVTAEAPVKPAPVMVSEPPEGLTVAGLDETVGATGQITAVGAKESVFCPFAVREPSWDPQFPQQNRAPFSSAQTVCAEIATSATLVLAKPLVDDTFTAVATEFAAPPSPSDPAKSEPQQ
ncbi:unannotated protein [freshwater metagenome]|uniref:Unannotated protein n=1 Tax=freshwater metagenome TaxID=449393 RepID=A0A6J6ETF2_9ZZZZ